MVKLFLDSEWSNDALRELVSLALVSEDGTHVFYAERDPLPEMPSSFVSKTVYPLLDRGETALNDQSMTQALRAFLEPLGASEILADAPLDFTMLDRVWSGRQLSPPTPPYRTTLAREGLLMQRLERYFELHPAESARRHHALVDAFAFRAVWLDERANKPLT